MRSGCTEAALDPRFRGGDMAGGYARASTVRHCRAKPALSLPKGGNPGRGLRRAFERGSLLALCTAL